MNDEDPKPGVVIDVTPEQRTGSDAPPSEAADQQADEAATGRGGSRGKGGALALIVALIALLGVAAAGFFGYRYVEDLKQELVAMDSRLGEARARQDQLRQTLNATSEAVKQQQGALGKQTSVLAEQRQAADDARNAFKAQEEKLAEENLRLQEREAELRAAVADVHRRVGRSGTQWIIAETEYLVRIAIHRLRLARDTKTARIALELADQRLRDTQDPGWAGVREQIARDIASLSAFEAPDSAGLSARLAALIERIPQLKIARATIGPERTLPQAVAHEPGERSWKTLVDDIWSGFKDSVRIRQRDVPVQAMLAPEHQFFLYENLKLHLQAARLGLARNDQALFRDNLNTAADWLGKYFDPDDGTASAIAKAIEEMVKIDIQPALPDVSQSLRTLLVRQKLMQEVAPSGVATE
jgi:uroporphyrin-3 C-methyltransferase